MAISNNDGHFHAEPAAGARGLERVEAHREAARASAKNNDFENATASYLLAAAEAESSFKGTDIRYLETVLEAGKHLTQPGPADGRDANGFFVEDCGSVFVPPLPQPMGRRPPDRDAPP